MDGIKKLAEIGVKEIVNKTHIESSYIEAVINKDVEALAKINRTKLNGFLTILEREYSLNLDEVRGEYSHGDNVLPKEEEKEEIFIVADKDNKSSMKFIFFIILIIILGYSYYNFSSKEVYTVAKIEPKKDDIKKSEEPKVEENIDIDNPEVIEIQKSVDGVVTDTNETSKDKNETVENKVESTEENNETSTEDANITNTISSISIIPKNKIWVGILYLDSMKKISTVDKNITLDLKRDQLVVTGHGLFKLHIDGDIKTYKQSKKVRLLYRDNNLTELSKEEYKTIGKGKAW